MAGMLLTAAGMTAVRYFTEYALKRGSSSENRKVEEKEGATESQREMIHANKKRLRQEKELWLRQVDMQHASLVSEDGLRLSGEYITIPGNHNWAILVHGYKADCHGMEVYGMEYYRRGYNILMPDNRACGESEGTYLGMGWLDRKDILRWINWIIEQDSESEIILHGVSMGGAAVMMVSGEKLPEQVRCFVEDCGYTSVWDVLASELKVRFSIPAFPLLNLSSLYSRVAAGYGFKEASAKKQVEKNCLPMLFIHGEEDHFVLTHMVYTLYNAASCEKELYIAEGAGHGQALNADPALYWEKVFGFIKRSR